MSKEVENLAIKSKGINVTCGVIKVLHENKLTFQESYEVLFGQVKALEEFIQKNPEMKDKLFQVQLFS